MNNNLKDITDAKIQRVKNISSSNVIPYLTTNDSESLFDKIKYITKLDEKNNIDEDNKLYIKFIATSLKEIINRLKNIININSPLAYIDICDFIKENFIFLYDDEDKKEVLVVKNNILYYFIQIETYHINRKVYLRGYHQYRLVINYDNEKIYISRSQLNDYVAYSILNNYNNKKFNMNPFVDDKNEKIEFIFNMNDVDYANYNLAIL